MRAAGHHAAVLRDGSAALVPFPVGGGDRVGGTRPPGRRPGISAGGFSWRPSRALGVPRTGGARVRRGGKEAVNPVTGKPAPAVTYAAATRAHSESVLRAFYDLHLEAGTGPMVNPFPLSRSRRGGRASAKTSSTSRDQAVFVDQAADAGLFPDAVLFKIDRFG